MQERCFFPALTHGFDVISDSLDTPDDMDVAQPDTQEALRMALYKETLESVEESVSLISDVNVDARLEAANDRIDSNSVRNREECEGFVSPALGNVENSGSSEEVLAIQNSIPGDGSPLENSAADLDDGNLSQKLTASAEIENMEGEGEVVSHRVADGSSQPDVSRDEELARKLAEDCGSADCIDERNGSESPSPGMGTTSDVLKCHSPEIDISADEALARRLAAEEEPSTCTDDDELARKLARDAETENSSVDVSSDEQLARKLAKEANTDNVSVDVSSDEQLARKLAQDSETDHFSIDVSRDEQLARKLAGDSDSEELPVVDISQDEELARKLAEAGSSPEVEMLAAGESDAEDLPIVDISRDEELARKLAAAGGSPEVDVSADEELARRLAMESSPPVNHTDDDAELARRLAMVTDSPEKSQVTHKLDGSEKSSVKSTYVDEDEALARKLAAEWGQPSSSSPKTPTKSLQEDKQTQLGQVCVLAVPEWQVL